MSRSIYRRCIAGVALTAGLSVATACGGGPSAPSADDALAIVVGAHANDPAPAPVGAVLADIDHAVHTQSAAAVVVNSGTPTVATQGQLSLNCNNDTACAQAIQTTTQVVIATIEGVRAQQSENNLLAAIQLGGRTLADHHGPKTLSVIDSGLQTIAPLRFQDPSVLAANPRDITDYLERTQQLPSLPPGTTVIYSGIGDTAPPQLPLSPAQRTNLKAIWDAIARRAGAVDVQFVEAPLTGAPAAGLPPVTPVPIDPPPGFTASTIDLSDALIPFEPDTAVLRDPAAAQTVLAALAQRITAAHAPVTLTGATANVGPLDGQRTLGKARANTIRDILVGLGVPAELLSTTGVGSAWPGYITDHDTAGVLLPGPAAQNRRVLITFVASRPQAGGDS